MEKLVKLWGHQEIAFERFKDEREFALFFDVGAGKTLTSLTVLRYKFNKDKTFYNTLILGPPIVLENWKREIKKFTKIPESKVHILSGAGTKRVKDFDKHKDTPCIFITNYASLLMPELHKRLMPWVEVIISDEMHIIKKGTSKTTKALIKLGDRAKYRMGLTGTPVLNSSLDLFSQFRFLDKGELFGRNYFLFRSKYFYDANAGMPKQKYFPDWKPRPGSYAELSRLIESKSMRIMKSECMDLPPLVKKQVFVELSPEQRRVYKEMERDFISFIEGEAVVSQLAITKALRLQQIVTGFVNKEEGEPHRFKKNPRADALASLLEDLTPNHKVIVWAVFKENYAQIASVCKKIGVEYVECFGGMKKKDQDINVDAFNNDEKVRVFIGHPGSAGIGINLVSSDVSIFYSRNFNQGYDTQAEGRNYRGGSERHKKITRIDLVCPDTIDEQVLESLLNKKKISGTILKDFIRGEKHGKTPR